MNVEYVWKKHLLMFSSITSSHEVRRRCR